MFTSHVTTGSHYVHAGEDSFTSVYFRVLIFAKGNATKVSRVYGGTTKSWGGVVPADRTNVSKSVILCLRVVPWGRREESRSVLPSVAVPASYTPQRGVKGVPSIYTISGYTSKVSGNYFVYLVDFRLLVCWRSYQFLTRVEGLSDPFFGEAHVSVFVFTDSVQDGARFNQEATHTSRLLHRFVVTMEHFSRRLHLILQVGTPFRLLSHVHAL